MHFATARALQDLRAFVLGDHALHLDQQSIFGTFSDGMFDKVNLHAALPKLFKDYLLMYVAPCKAVRAVDEHDVE